ncbi:MAG TPA: hypothetical protein VH639_24425 [Bryobacteraceae bacterium]|jgi:hypothetical protein
MRTTLKIVLMLTGAGVGHAQWLHYLTPGIPRLPDGKPNLSAPAPRKDGKPDLSGIWRGDRQNTKYFGNVAADFKPGEFPIQPWGEALTKERRAGFQAKERPDANCIPIGVPQYYDVGAPFKIVQEPGLVVILYESFGAFRQIFLDGRPLPEDPNPSWMGYSVGRWDGDTLVVETTGFNGKKWLDQGGHPSTDALHITERFRRRTLGHLDIEFTVDDPKAYTKPWTLNLPQLLFADSELLEFVCNENEKDLKHMTDR